MYFNIILSPTLGYSSLSLSLSQVFRPKCFTHTPMLPPLTVLILLYLIAITVFPEGHKLPNSMEYRVLLEKLGWSGNSLHFMEPECLLPRYNSPPTVLILIQIHPDQAPSPQTYFLKIYFNIVLSSTPKSYKWSLATTILHKDLNATLLSPVRVNHYAVSSSTL